MKRSKRLAGVDVVDSSCTIVFTRALWMETPNICFTKATKEKENCLKGAYFLCTPIPMESFNQFQEMHDRLKLFRSSHPSPASSFLATRL
jgi:hypothetical protein